MCIKYVGHSGADCIKEKENHVETACYLHVLLGEQRLELEAKLRVEITGLTSKENELECWL